MFTPFERTGEEWENVGDIMFLNLETHETKVCHLDTSTIEAMVNGSLNLYDYDDNSFPIFDNTEFKTLMSDKNTWFPIGICVIPREFTENNKSRWVFLYNVNWKDNLEFPYACPWFWTDNNLAYYLFNSCIETDNKFVHIIAEKDNYNDINTYMPNDTDPIFVPTSLIYNAEGDNLVSTYINPADLFLNDGTFRPVTNNLPPHYKCITDLNLPGAISIDIPFLYRDPFYSNRNQRALLNETFTHDSIFKKFNGKDIFRKIKDIHWNNLNNRDSDINLTINVSWHTLTAIKQEMQDLMSLIPGVDVDKALKEVYDNNRLYIPSAGELAFAFTNVYNINMISAYILKMAARYSNNDINRAYNTYRDPNNDRYTDIFQPQDTMSNIYFYDTMTFFTNDDGYIYQLLGYFSAYGDESNRPYLPSFIKCLSIEQTPIRRYFYEW